MKILDNFVNKINFNKAVKIYLIILLLATLLCGGFISYIMRDKIYMAADYVRISRSFKNEGYGVEIQAELDKLSKSSKDIVNVIVEDKSNNIIYKSNSNIVGDTKTFIFTPYEFSNIYLKDNINEDIIYRVVPEDNIILNRDYITNHEKIVSDIDDDFYYEQILGSTKVELVNFLGNKFTGEKIFILREASSIPYAREGVKILAAVFSIMFMLYWIGLCLWVYKDSNKKNINSALWGLLVLITNLVGLIIYTMYKQTNNICDKCGSIQSKESIYCTVCGNKINRICDKCGSIIDKEDKFCSKCGSDLESSYEFKKI
ncbi:zinc ribbon domain-containing protein [Clostridium sp. 19966]|uniref:zinc ribbon domain-containing protein n=1 Tax=Clostridium sp. 19966 TaxID=2768166 RepID=UPI0028DE5E80|nr:zinc ribbon domain-containing protein [Clostridium sp. 19966]MDT8715723.1 zinc ribbon domain-containing protein [Clostridium sp. 19966]